MESGATTGSGNRQGGGGHGMPPSLHVSSPAAAAPHFSHAQHTPKCSLCVRVPSRPAWAARAKDGTVAAYQPWRRGWLNAAGQCGCRGHARGLTAVPRPHQTRLSPWSTRRLPLHVSLRQHGRQHRRAADRCVLGALARLPPLPSRRWCNHKWRPLWNLCSREWRRPTSSRASRPTRHWLARAPS